jgi:hypothetical protein
MVHCLYCNHALRGLKRGYQICDNCHALFDAHEVELIREHEKGHMTREFVINFRNTKNKVKK